MLLKEVMDMLASVTYQAILNAGKSEEALKMLLLIGTQRFGAPSDREHARLTALSVERLEALSLEALTATSWSGLLRG